MMSDHEKLVQEIKDLAGRLGVELSELAPPAPPSPVPDPTDIVPGTVPLTTIYRVSWRLTGRPVNDRVASQDFVTIDDANAYASQLKNGQTAALGSVKVDTIPLAAGQGWIK